MTRRTVFIRGMFAGMLVVFAAQSGNWLLTPAAHPDASELRRWGVALQVVIGLAGAIWLTRGMRDS